MPRGPKGEKRPADVIGNEVHVMWMPRVSSLQSPAPCFALCQPIWRAQGIVRFYEVTPSLETLFHQSTETCPEPVTLQA